MVNLLLIYVINIFKNNENMHIESSTLFDKNVSHSNGAAAWAGGYSTSAHSQPRLVTNWHFYQEPLLLLSKVVPLELHEEEQKATKTRVRSQLRWDNHLIIHLQLKDKLVLLGNGFFNSFISDFSFSVTVWFKLGTKKLCV